MTRRVLLLLFLIAAAGIPRTAKACSPPRCLSPVVLPYDGATVPANMTAIEITTELTIGDLSFELRNAMGALVAVDASRSGPLFKAQLKAPLAPGSYTLRFNVECRDQLLEPATTRFTVTASAPPPASIGTVTVTERLGMFETATPVGSCTTEVAAALAEFDFKFDAALLLYKPLTRFTLEVDGTKWASPPVGMTGPMSAFLSYSYQRSVDLVASLCETKPYYVEPGVSSGMHRGVLRANVQGVGDLKPLEFDFRTDCTSPAADMKDSTMSGSASGCSVPQGSPASPGGALLFSLALLTLLARRARRTA